MSDFFSKDQNLGCPLKEGDVIARVPVGYQGVISFGYNEYGFLRFCANHPKPFGFNVDYKRFESNQRLCPKCGDEFIADESRSFVTIVTGYTILQRFRGGVEIYNHKAATDTARSRVADSVPDVLDAEYLE